MQRFAEAARSRSLIETNKIRTDGGTQSRSGIDEATVDAYAYAYREGIEMPPIDVFYDGEHYWLADGFHRLAACAVVSFDRVDAIVHQGTRRDAVLYACGANASHGLRRTREDKRRAIRTLLLDSEWSQWSDRAIAKICRVNHETVGAVRREVLDTEGEGWEKSKEHAEVLGQAPATAKRIGLDGRIIDVSGLQARAVRAQRAEGEGRGGESSGSERGKVHSNNAGEVVLFRESAQGEGCSRSHTVESGLERAIPSQEQANACIRWLSATFELPDVFDAVVPSVGGGEWVKALYGCKPEVVVSRFDSDPQALGLQGSRRTGGSGATRPGEMYVVADWLVWQPGRFSRRSSWDLCVGQRSCTSGLEQWVEMSLLRAPLVALFERELVTGEGGRLSWWRTHRPSHLVKVVSQPREGVKETQDSPNSVLIVWQRGGVRETRFDWIDVGVVLRDHSTSV